MSQFVDYTQWSERRKSLHKLPIAPCPKCGRNGEHTFSITLNGSRVDKYIHQATIREVEGLRFYDVSDYCWIRQEEAAP